MTVPMIKSIGDVPYPIDTHSDTFSPLLTAGAALGITGDGPTDSAAWLQRVSTSDGPTTIRSIHGNTIVESGALVSVNMTGIESTGFNQWDEQWESGEINTNTGVDSAEAGKIRSKDYIPIFAGMEYYAKSPAPIYLFFYDADKNYLGFHGSRKDNATFTPASLTNALSGGGSFASAAYMRFRCDTPTYNNDICINISDTARNGTYEPHWSQERSIPATDLRSAGTAYDEQTETERITRVGEVDLGTLTWIVAATGSTGQYRMVSSELRALVQKPASNAVLANITCQKYDAHTSNEVYQLNVGICIDAAGDIVVYDPNYATSESAAAFKTAMSGVMLHYALATPTTTPIDPQLNMTYRTAAGGTERVMVPTGDNSAPPTIVAAQGYTAENLRDAALSAIAPVENGRASTNYAVGAYLVHGGQLCKVTTAIATGEAITIGTNVTATTAMAEVIALIAQ